MQTTRYHGRAVFMAQWLMGLALAALVIPAVPSLVFGEEANPAPTGKVPDTVELPVDISIDIATDDEAALPKPAVTIHLLNTKSGTDVDWTLPKSNVASDHTSIAEDHSPFDTLPVEAPFDTSPAVPELLDVPGADLPSIDPATMGVPSVDTLPTLPPNAGRP